MVRARTTHETGGEHERVCGSSVELEKSVPVHQLSPGLVCGVVCEVCRVCEVCTCVCEGLWGISVEHGMRKLR